MLLIVLAYLGGVLTILSPCILPVLPFVFSRAGQPFSRSGLPLLAGMALTFAAVASLAAVGGGWVVAANQYGRWAALVLVALFSLTLLWPGAGRAPGPAAGGAGRPAVGNRRGGDDTPGARRLAAAGRGHRPAVGALRGPDPRA